MEVIIDTAVFIFVKFFAIAGIICGTIGMIAFFIYFLIRGIIALKGAIVTEKIWRVALKEYVEKRNPNAKRVGLFKHSKFQITPKDFEKKDGDN